MPDRPPRPPASPPTPAADRWLLRCPACGRADQVAAADLIRHTREGWPKCCGQVMGYVREAAPAAARCPTCGRPAALTFPAATPTGAAVRIVCLGCALGPAAEARA